MFCVATDHGVDKPAGGFFLVGFGNTHRRDDGLGPWVVARTFKSLKKGHRVEAVFQGQLLPELAEILAGAEKVVLVDAAGADLGTDRLWRGVVPSLKCDSWITHSISPEYLMGLIEMMGGRSPAAWLITIQGEDFGYGQGFSNSAARRAKKVIAELVSYISKEGYNG